MTLMAVEPCCASSSFSPAARGTRSRHCPPVSSLPATSTSSNANGRRLLIITHPLPPIHRAVTRPRPRRRLQVAAVFERFTERAVRAAVLSQREARSMGGDLVLTHHLLLGLIAEERSPVGFLGSGIDIDQARLAVAKLAPPQTARRSQQPATDVPFSVECKRVFETAVEFSRSMRCNFISPEHLALGLLTVDDEGIAALVLKSLGADIHRLQSVALARIQAEMANDGREPAATTFEVPQKSSAVKSAIVKFSDKKKEKSALGQFCVDLTMGAIQGLIDPVIGRDREVQRIIQILCRRTRNNPILLGDPGVGKTAIAEGLALRISEADVPIFLVGKRILSLDVGLLMAGAKERGELEARVTGLIKELQKSGDVILFVDEVHNLIGSGMVGKGSKGSGLDIANLLKPALGRGEIQCIASTTIEEHRLHFEKDKALARRFQPVFVDEPSQDDAVKILLGLREKYEAFHQCKYTIEAIKAAVYLSARYIPDRRLPDKAIDLLDEAGSRAHMDAFKRRKEEQSAILSKSPDEYWQEIRAVQAMHEVVLTNKMKYLPNKNGDGDYGSADTLSLAKRVSKPKHSPSSKEIVAVGPEEIARVASLWSGIPVQQLTAVEKKLLVGLDEELRRRVIGQEDAVVAISRAVKRSRIGLGDPRRPIATFLFCGPTGVGKTELTKALASSYFGSESVMLRLDMSEYMERHAVSKLIGSPPGYIGYGEGGTLTEAVRRRAFTVVLLDEIEKAHPDVFNLLLQIFEDGHLTDSKGRRVSFKNTLIVMTSNIGSTSITKGRRSIGFLLSDNKESSSYAGMKAIVLEELKSYFRPELLNRIDEVVVFRPLEKHQMMNILHIILQEVKGRLASLGINLEVSEAMKELVCQQGYDANYGARPLRRAVTGLIEDVISEAILSGACKSGDTIKIDTSDTGTPFVSRSTDQPVQLSDAQ